MCGVVPTPPEPKLSAPGFAFAIAITSLTDCAGSAGGTTRASGEMPVIDTPTNSLAGSKLNLR